MDNALDKLMGMLKAIVGAVLALGTLFLAFILGREAGASTWLTGAVTISLVFLAGGAYSYRKHDGDGRKNILLIGAGFIALSIAGIINEYVVRFFTPHGIYVLLAISPGILFATYRAFKEENETICAPEGKLRKEENLTQNSTPPLNAPGNANFKAMYCLFIFARVGFLISMVAAVLVASVNAKPELFKVASYLMVCFFAFLDALLSYILPSMERIANPKSKLMVLLSLSPFSGAHAHATSTYRLLCAVFSFMGFIWLASKAIGP